MSRSLKWSALLGCALASFALHASTFQSTEGPRLSAPRAYHTATLLADGTVLVAGGLNADGVLATADILNAVTKRVELTIPLMSPRYRHTATLLPDGRVLIAGGVNDANQALASAEIYDPAKKAMRAAGTLNESRAMHTASLLADGSVFLAGGRDGGVLRKTCERFDPVTERFGIIASLPEGRYDHTATTLPDGRIVIGGGSSLSKAASITTGELAALVYSPDSRTFASLRILIRSKHVAVLMPDGRVYLVGGNNAGSNKIDVANGQVTDDLYESGWIYGSAATALKDGPLICAGYFAFSTGPSRYLDFCNQHTKDNLYTANLLVRRAGHTATTLADGTTVLLTGGMNDTGPTDRTEVVTSK